MREDKAIPELKYEQTVQAFKETCPDGNKAPTEQGPLALPSNDFEGRYRIWKHSLFAAWGLEDDPQLEDWYQLGINMFGDPCWGGKRDEFICFMMQVARLLSERK